MIEKNTKISTLCRTTILKRFKISTNVSLSVLVHQSKLAKVQIKTQTKKWNPNTSFFYYFSLLIGPGFSRKLVTYCSWNLPSPPQIWGMTLLHLVYWLPGVWGGIHATIVPWKRSVKFFVSRRFAFREVSSPLGDCPKCIFEWLLHNMENGLALLCELVNCGLGAKSRA